MLLIISGNIQEYEKTMDSGSCCEVSHSAKDDYVGPCVSPVRRSKENPSTNVLCVENEFDNEDDDDDMEL